MNNRLMQMLQQGGGGGMPGMGGDAPVHDTSEKIHISALSLLKMLKHGRAGVPMEVMGLMLGEFIDDYTVRVVDVFAMPQSGTSVSVESVDEVFQTEMLEMLNQTGRPEMVVGWYHSHPGFGCWLSGTDVSTQQSFEQLNSRAVAVVVDPIQSVKGKVVIDAFRNINPQLLMMGREPRQTTSHLGHLNRPSIQALIHGLDRHYYSISTNFHKGEYDLHMLLNLKKAQWRSGLDCADFAQIQRDNEDSLKQTLDLVRKLDERLDDEKKLTKEQRQVAHVGKVDPRKRLRAQYESQLKVNLVQSMGLMLDTLLF